MLVMPDSSRTVGSDLRRLLREDQIKDDPPTKTAYAVDASIYRMDPQAVALVESEEDIHRLLRYAVERVFANATLVRVELETGLQNQIRAQFAALGHPIIGDRKYHREEAREQLIARVALHAENLQFIHPRTGEPLSVHCKPPADFQHLIRALAQEKSPK